MSKSAAEHHKKAAEHYELAARHHREAAKHHTAGDPKQAGHQAHLADGHDHQAHDHVIEAAKAHVDEHGRE